MTGTERVTIENVFKMMDYGSVMESDSLLQDWLSHYEVFGFFINGEMKRPTDRKTFEVRNPSTGTRLSTHLEGTESDIIDAVNSAKDAFSLWNIRSSHSRAKYLYSIARNIQKHQQLLTVLECTSTGTALHEVKDYDVPAVVRSFYYHAGWAQLMSTEFAAYKPIGVVALIIPSHFSIMQLSQLVAPAIATGNTVVVKPDSLTPLSALFLADILKLSGLPPGVFNVVTGTSESLLKHLIENCAINKINFIGPAEVGKNIRRVTAGSGKILTLTNNGKSSMIIFESVDEDAAVEGIIDGAFFHNGQSSSAVSRLFIQESIFDLLVSKLLVRMEKLRVGNGMDKTMDVGSVRELAQLSEYVRKAKKDGAQVFQSEIHVASPTGGSFYPPTLITHADSNSVINIEEIFGPIVAAFPFRTAKEAIALANNSRYGTAASVWTENSALAMEVATALKVGTVWINCHNMSDSAAPFGGCKQSGYGRYGGKEGLLEFLQSSGEISSEEMEAPPPAEPVGNKQSVPAQTETIDRTYKLYIGGSQKRPDGNVSWPVLSTTGEVLAQVGEGGKKDIRNAVEAANIAQRSWMKRSGHNRAQILYYLSENLDVRRNEFVRQLRRIKSEEEAEMEVEASVERIFHWAAYADKFGGTVQETSPEHLCISCHEPLGVIGIVCPKEFPLLAFVSLVTPAIARGNSVVVIPSRTFPLCALDLCQVFDCSDLPGGVINVVSGDPEQLSLILAQHHDVAGVWYFGNSQGAATKVESASADNVKRTWTCTKEKKWLKGEEGDETFLFESTRTKTIWIPVGESFAN